MTLLLITQYAEVAERIYFR